MIRRRRALVGVAAFAVVAGAAALVLRADGDHEGPLAGFLPQDVNAALRCEGVGLTRHRVAALLRAGGARAEDPVGALDLAGGLLPGADAARAVFGREVIVSTRDGELLVLTRLTRYGRSLVGASLAASGTPVENPVGRLRTVDAGGGRWFCARDRDVLAAGTDEALVRHAMACGERRFAAADSPFGSALGTAEPIPGRVDAWCRGAFADEWLGLLLDRGPAEFLLDAVPLEDAESLAATLELHSEGARLTWATRLGDDAGTAALLASDAPPAEDLLALARRLAPPGEAMLVAGARIRADEALRRFVESLPEPLRPPDGAAEAPAGSVRDGVAIVLTRLPETDGLDVESPAPGAPEVLAGSIVALRLRDPGVGAALARGLTDAWRASEDTDPRWTLARPAAAVVGDLLVLASHEGLLARSLAARTRAGEPPSGASADAGAFVLAEVTGPTLHAFAQDVRGNAGRAALPRSSPSLRRAVSLHLRAGRTETGAALDAIVEAETRRLTESRSAQAFGDAVSEHRARVAPLAEVASASISVRVEGGEVLVRADVRLR